MIAILRTAVLALASLGALSAMAQPPAPALTSGEVRKIDKDAGKITIQHGTILHMEMPTMTMVFVAQDPALLDKTHVGARIRFMATRDDKGRMLVTDIQPAK